MGVVSAAGKVKVADFGTAKLAGVLEHGDIRRSRSSVVSTASLTMTTHIGTLLWMAPEVIYALF